jgi:hypothetical protein
MAWGNCPVCRQWKDLTKDHVKDDSGKKTGEILSICRDCHTILESYRREVANMRKSKQVTKGSV